MVFYDQFNRIVVLLMIINLVYCWFEYCDHTINLDNDKSIYIVSPYYPLKYPFGSSCRYTIVTIPNNQLEFNCTIDLEKDYNLCSNELFYFNSEGPKTFYDSDYFCGNGTFIRNSLFNQATIFYISKNNSNNSQITTNSNGIRVGDGGGGWFKCLIKSKPQLCDCGWSMSGKIVGGSEAFINEFPSMAGIVRFKKVFCGATIIHHRYVLSAAHCFVRKGMNEPKNIGVLVGEHDLKNENETVYTELYNVEKIILHENFDRKFLTNDIALIRTEKMIQWYEGVGPACLPYKFNKRNFIGKKLDVAGWGTTSFGGYQSSILLKTTLDVIEQDKCSKYISALNENQFCTYTDQKDTCQYDSGGALYYRSNRNYAIGVISYGYACALRIPSVNTDIFSYIPWIEKNANDALFCKK